MLTTTFQLELDDQAMPAVCDALVETMTGVSGDLNEQLKEHWAGAISGLLTRGGVGFANWPT